MTVGDSDNARSNQVTVIIPTTCDPVRLRLLSRAIDSVLAQSDVQVKVLVVVNGPLSSERAELVKRPRVSVITVPVASLPLALLEGRKAIESPFFAFLDDDDEYLPGALALKLAAIQKWGADFVVARGYGVDGRLLFPDWASIAENPLRALLRFNWLASCGGLFRTSTIPVDLWDGRTKYLEWTLLAFKLILAGKSMRLIDAPTFRIHDTPDSASKKMNDEVVDTAARVHRYMLRHCPPELRAELRMKEADFLHDVAFRYLRHGSIRAAWRYHLQSLPHGFSRYLFCTRHLIGTTLSLARQSVRGDPGLS
jgi:glycosyltransferase involved in cell wall biosynthesis